MLAADGLNHRVELLKEKRAVARFHRGGPSRDCPCVTQLRHEIPGRYGMADVIVPERLSGCPDDLRTRFQTPARQRNVGGDDNVMGLEFGRHGCVVDA